MTIIRTLSLFLLLPLFACDCDGAGGLHQRKPDIEVSPNPLVFDAAPHTTLSRLLHIVNPGDFRLDISSITIEEGASAGFGIGGETAFNIEPQASRDLEVRFTAGEPATAEGTLLIQSSADKKEQTRVALKVTRRQGPVLIVCVESIDIPLAVDCGSPATIDFGRVLLEETREARITLRSEGTEPVLVSSVSLFGHPSLAIDAPTVPKTIAIGQQIQFPLRFTASVPEQIEGKVSIQSNDAVTPNVEVAVRGQGGELGLCIEPTPLNFGRLRVGDSKDLTLRLSNCGTAPIDITDAEVYLGAPEFSLLENVASPITLPPQSGLTFEMKVRYAPADEGEDMGRLRIRTSNGAAAVYLTGEGRYACHLVATPSSISFAWNRGIGASPMNLLIENAGAEPCTVSRIAITDGIDKGFAFVVTPFGRITVYGNVPQVLAPAQAMTVEILFYPPEQFDHSTVTGKIQIDTLERPSDSTLVDLVGALNFTSVCNNLTVDPDSLGFGVIGLGQRRSLAVSLHGGEPPTPCKLDSIALSNDGNGAFALQANPPDVVFPQAVVFVEFTANTAGAHQGTLEIRTAGATPQMFTIPLFGGAGSSDLCVSPRDLPFGPRSTPSTQVFNITACASDAVTIHALDWIVPDAEFSLPNPPALPFTLNPGETRTIPVQYNPQDAGGDTAILAVRSTDIVHPEITVRATGGREIVPPTAGRYLYYWQILNGAQGDILRQPLQGDLTPLPYWGPRTGHACAGCHQLSPDGRYVALTTIIDTARTINIIDVEANAVTTAQGGVVEALYMSWNPDVNTTPPYQYVYSSGGDLHLASLYAGYIGPLTGAAATNYVETMPNWGPDGQIAFVRADNASGVSLTGPASIYLIDEAGGVPAALAGASNNTFANYYPRYSPNGMWIAYTLSESAGSTLAAADAKIRLLRADNSGQVLTLPLLNRGASSYPTWSPNGDFISFSSDRTGGQGGWDIYIAPIDPLTGQEGAAFNVTEANTSSFDHSAQWSP